MVEPLRNFPIAFKMEKLKIKFILMVENATEVRMKLRSKLNFSPIRLQVFFQNAYKLRRAMSILSRLWEKRYSIFFSSMGG